jgi:hypothetical protein
MGSNYILSRTFTDALFDTIVERKYPPKLKRQPYDIQGVHTAFVKLVTAYVQDASMNGTLSKNN